MLCKPGRLVAMRTMTRCAALLALAELVIGVAACSDASGTSATNGSGAGGAATATATSGGAPAATATATTAASTYQIEVFFSKHPDSDSNPAAVFPVHRTAPNLQVATYAIQQLIAGPTAGEQASGYYTPLMGNLSGASNCGGADFQITLNKKGTTPEQGTATLTFCRAVKREGGRSLFRRRSLLVQCDLKVRAAAIRCAAQVAHQRRIVATRLLTSRRTGDQLLDGIGRHL